MRTTLKVLVVLIGVSLFGTGMSGCYGWLQGDLHLYDGPAWVWWSFPVSLPLGLLILHLGLKLPEDEPRPRIRPPPRPMSPGMIIEAGLRAAQERERRERERGPLGRLLKRIVDLLIRPLTRERGIMPAMNINGWLLVIAIIVFFVLFQDQIGGAGLPARHIG